MHTTTKTTLPLTLLALSIGFISAPATAEDTSDSLALLNPDDRSPLVEFIEQGRDQWNIPGMAVGIVHNDQLVFAEGFGVIGLEQPDPIDQDTLFGVASTTKAMTAATLAMLVDDGKLDWDDRVIEHLPYFRLSDPWVTHEVRIRDLLSHQVGVGRMTGNQIRYMPNASRETIIRQMQHHQFEAPFRSRYVYSNVMYSVAGEIVAAVSGQSWDEFMAERLFTPLNMQRSNTSITQFDSSDRNIARPHQYIDGEIVPIERRNFDNVGPSASVNTSIHDMAQWIRLQLGEPGVYQGEQLLSDAVMREMHQAQVTLNRSDRTEALRGYGLGWSLGEYRGFATSSHGGATDGFNTSLTLVPELDLGIVVITNTFDGYRPAVVNEIVDRIAGLPEYDWHSHYYDDFQARFEQAMNERQEILDARQPDTAPSVSQSQMVGRYRDDLYGEIEVSEGEDGQLVLHFWDDGESLLDLDHWHYDTWLASYRNRAQREKFVYFSRAADGGVEALNVRFTLRPVMTQVGLFPTNYYRDVRFTPVDTSGHN